MSFSENLQYLRKQKDITQEQLAEQLEVSRQSVSKWESGQSFPEMEKLLQLCNMFHCNMDTLMQGDVSKTFAKDSHGYDKVRNQFAKMITLGVSLILLGVSVMFFLNATGMNENFSVIVLFAFIIVAILIFVVMGLQYGQFCEKHPVIEDFYTEEEKDQAYKRFTVTMAVGIGIILLSVLFFLVGTGITDGKTQFRTMSLEQMEQFLMGIFMLFLTAGVVTLVYGGLQKDKYDIDQYNKEGNPSSEKKKKDSLIGAVCGSIFIVATIIYLLTGFLRDGWSTMWVVYPVAALLCGIASLVIAREEN